MAPLPAGPGGKNLLPAILGAAAAYGLARLFMVAEGDRRADVGLTPDAGTLARFALGAGAGIVTAGLMLTVVIGLSGSTVAPVPAPDYWNAIAYSTLILLLLALMEEIAFRSYPLVRLREAFGTRAAIYTTAVCFAFYHGMDPGNLLGPGVWGLVFGLAAVVSRGIALPLGLHFGLNWTQSLFGLKTEYATSLWTIAVDGDAAVVSAPTAGLAIQLALLATAAALIEWHLRRRAGRDHL